MWWRKHSPFEKLGLPRKCFISHSYKDADAREQLLNLLPKSVTPFVFPPIVVPPEQMISTKLLDAIQKCGGLIYLRGGESERSFWVVLERDYALRQGKRVFAFDSETSSLSWDNSAPMTLKVYLIEANTQIEAARRIVNTLRLRNFDVWFDVEHIRDTNFVGDPGGHPIEQAILAGGYIVFLCSDRMLLSGQIDAEIRSGQGFLGTRILFGLLDNATEVPSSVDPIKVVQVYGDSARAEAHRIDDLIVRLYWLIYRNTRQNQLT